MLNVRLASADDRDEVMRLARGLLIELGGNPAPAEELHWLFNELVANSGTGFAVIAEEDGAAIAVCTASFQKAIRKAGKYCILQEMFVEPETQSTGVGKAVIDFALRHAVDSGCQVVELGTPRDGQRPIRFYERSGFENIGARMRWRTTDNRYR